MIVIARFEVASEHADQFETQARAAVEVLQGKSGLRSLDLAQNLDDRALWTLTMRWDDVGSYRRGLGGIDAKMAVVPLLSLAIDEPTAFEDPALLDPIRYRGQD